MNHYYIRRNAVLLFLLWATGFWGWSNQILAAEGTAEVPNTSELTATQQQWLESELQKHKSCKKQFKKLLVHINHPESSIRLAAYQGLCQLLRDHEKLANKGVLQHIKKIFTKKGIREETQEALYLLNALVNANPKLALPTALIVVQLTKSAQQSVTERDVSQKALALLIPTIVNTSPDCAFYFIKRIHERTRAAEGSFVASTSGVTIPGLNVAASLLQMDIVRDNPQYFNQALEVVLDGASLRNIVRDHTPTKDPNKQPHAQTLLKKMIQQYPTAMADMCRRLTKKAENEVPDVVALAYLTACAAVDHQRTAPLFVLFDDILEATNARVAALENQLYSKNRAASKNKNVGGGLTGWVTGAIVNLATKGIDKKIARKEAIQQDNKYVRVPLLRLLREITAWDKSRLPETFTIFQRVLGKEEKSNWVRTEALDTLTHMVSQGHSSSYQLQVIRMMSSHAQAKSADVRKAALQLLNTILKTNRQHTTDAMVLDSLNKFRQDKNVRIRKKAEELFSEYVGS